MAEQIRGINVTIGANTTGLSEALDDVRSRGRGIQTELRQVERLLRFDPSNTELLAQRQQVLGNAIANTRERLDALRQAQQQVNEQFQRGEISPETYRDFQRQIAAAEQQLQRFESRAQSTGRESRTLGDRLREISEAARGVGDKLKGIGEKMSMAITAPIAGFAALAVEGTQELRSDLARLETNAKQAGAEIGVVNDVFRDMYAVTGETDSSVEALSNVLETGFKGEKFKTLMDELAGAAIKFSDTLKLEGIADGLQETLATGAAIGPFAELLERSGVVLDDFNAGLTEAIANGTQEQYVLDTLAKLGLAETYEQYKKNNEAMLEYNKNQMDLQMAMVELGNIIMPVMTRITQKITELLNWFNGLDESTQKLILTIGGIAAVVGPLLIVFGAIASAVGALAPLFTAVGAAIGAISAPIAIAIAAVAALIAIGVAVYKNWDEIKAKASEIWKAISDSVSKTVDDLKQALSKAWNGMKSDVSTAWENIKSSITNIWNNISSGISSTLNTISSTVKSRLESVWSYIKSIPSQALQWGKDIIQRLIDGFKSIHIPTPHFDFSVSTKSIAGLDVPVPNVDVDWYKTGGIFNKPTIAGIGDVPEAVLPLSRLAPMLTDALSNAINTVMPTNVGSGDLVFNFTGPVTVRNDNDIKLIARELHSLQQRASRGRGIK